MDIIHIEPKAMAALNQYEEETETDPDEYDRDYGSDDSECKDAYEGVCDPNDPDYVQDLYE